MADIKITVIGTGYMGEKHVRAVSEHPFLTLDSVVDIDEKRAEQIATKFGATKALTDYELALRRADGAIIATPAEVHLEQAHAAIDNEAAVLLEKPITTEQNTVEARELVERESETDVVTGMSFLRRYMPAFSQAHTAAKNGGLGDIVSVRAMQGGTESTTRRTEGRIHPIHRSTIHDIDMIRWCVDRKITAVCTLESSNVLSDLDVPDATQTLLSFEDGTTGVLESYHALQHPQGRFELIGTEETVTITHPSNQLTIGTERYEYPDTSYWPVVNGHIDGCVRKQIDWFAGAIVNDQQMLADIEDGFAAQIVADAILRSIGESGAVTVEF